MDTYIVASKESPLSYRVTYIIPKPKGVHRGSADFSNLLGSDSSAVEFFVKSLGLQGNTIHSKLSVPHFGRLPGRILNPEEIDSLKKRGIELLVD
jgi:hypothetical protein